MMTRRMALVVQGGYLQQGERLEEGCSLSAYHGGLEGVG
jgi:hypothetical protein